MGRGKRQRGNGQPLGSAAAISAPPLCLSCVHRHEDARYCDAFPEGIPQVIIRNGHDHREPYPGDRGITYAPKAPGEPRFDPFAR